MALEGALENIKTSLSQLKDKALESALAQKIQERYENLNPSQQKLTLTVLTALVSLSILYFPTMELLSSSDEYYNFEDKRALTKALIKSHREVNHLPDIPVPQNAENVKSIIDNQMKDMNLIPEQIKYVTINLGHSQIIPQNKIQYGIEVGVSKLNLKQITNFGSKLQSIHPAVKLKDLILSSNKQDGRYIDATFKLIALNIPRYTPPLPEPEPEKKSKKTKKTETTEE